MNNHNTKILIRIILTLNLSCFFASADEPKKEDIWQVRYALVESFSHEVRLLFSRIEHMEDAERKHALKLLIATRICTYWLVSSNMPGDGLNAVNPAVDRMEEFLKIQYRKLNLSTEEARYPLGAKDIIMQLDGTFELSDKLTSCGIPFFPPAGLRNLSQYTEFIEKFDNWLKIDGATKK